MSTSLHANLRALTSRFTDQVLEAIRTASLEELLDERGEGPRSAVSLKSRRAGRPAGPAPRRSAEDLSATLDQIVTLLKKHKGGLRAEQIRKELGLDRKALPRPLKAGLQTRKLRSRGQRRATTYFAM